MYERIKEYRHRKALGLDTYESLDDLLEDVENHLSSYPDPDEMRDEVKSLEEDIESLEEDYTNLKNEIKEYYSGISDKEEAENFKLAFGSMVRLR